MKKNRFYMNSYFTDEQMAEDIEEVKNKIKPFEVTQEVSGKMQRWEIVNDEPYLTVKVMSWEFFFGKIEQWEFLISEKVFYVNKRNLIMCEKGPFIWLKK